MSPRRSADQTTLSPRRLRRGKAQGAAGQKLVAVAFAASNYRSGVAGSGASVRLQTASGQNILLAGVAVTVSLLSTGSGSASLSAAPSATATTDANGVASFTNFTLTGTAGSYSFQYTATGYQPLITSGHTLSAGSASATTSSAVVPDGRVGQTTTVGIILRDAQGNVLTVAASGAVTVQVTGVNPIPQSTVPYQASLPGYQFQYTPAIAGTDTITVKYAGVNVSGSPDPSVVSGNTAGRTATSLRSGLNLTNIPSLLGTGPTPGATDVWTTAEPIFSCGQGVLSPSQIVAAIATADNKDLILMLVMPGSRASFTNPSGSCLIYDDAKFRAAVDVYAAHSSNAVLTDALRRRRVVFYMLDEPWISSFCGSIPPWRARAQFAYVKSIWPNSIVTARFEPQFLTGWGGHILQPDGVYQDQLPVNYFHKLDYSWATYAPRRAPWATYTTPLSLWTAMWQMNKDMGYGTILAGNWVNLGDKNICWDARNNGVSNAHIYGLESHTGRDNEIVDCPDTGTTEGRYYSPVSELRAMALAAITFTDVPCMQNYLHPGNAGFIPDTAEAGCKVLFRRADYVSAWQDHLRVCESRGTFTGWRTPK